MNGVVTTVPSTAERVRSVCLRAEHTVLAVEGSAPVATTMRFLRSPGEIVMVVPADSTVGAVTFQAGSAGVPAVLELTDHAPLDLREPVRSLVWLSGELRRVPDNAERAVAAAVASQYPHAGLLDVGHSGVLLRLILESVVVADATGAEPLSVRDLMAAEPDPFWEVEGGWLQHLDSDHSDMVHQIARRLPPSLRTGRPRPLSIDRYGVGIRVEGPSDDHDVRIPFASPVDDVTELSKALRVLAGCPFMNGLRARDHH